MRTLLEPVITIAWNVWHYPDVMDFVDVILLAVLIYQMIIHVRQTRVSQTLKGIVILLFLESMWVRLGLLFAFLAAGMILTLRNRDEVLAVIRQFRK